MVRNGLDMVAAVFSLIFLLAGTVIAGNNSGAAFTTWPDTGQTKCYNNSAEIPCPAAGEPFYGQDAQHTGPIRSYTLLGGGTMVQDNVTGLVWEMKGSKDTIKNYSDPHDSDNTYTWCDPDPSTNGGNAGTCGANDTKDFIDQLNSGGGFGSHTDWRLPTFKELTTLVDLSRTNPAIDPVFVTTTQSSYYWSSTTDAGNPSDAWLVTFNYGNDYNDGKSSAYYVRAVRGGQLPSENRFVDNDDGTVTDTVTCLQWQKATMDTKNGAGPDTYTWQDALAVSEGLSLAGHSDWRLPDRNELHSLVDYNRYVPAIDPVFAATTQLSYYSHYWSSTTHAGGPSVAWLVHFYGGTVYLGNKSSAYYVRAVRGGQCGNFGALTATIHGITSAANTQGMPQGILPGATVALPGRGSVTSDSAGHYQFSNLPAGTYPVTVSSDGYLPVTRSITLIGGQVSIENFILAQQAQAGAPQSFGFESSTGTHVIDGMPGNLTFRTGIAWNGSPGSVRYRVNGTWQTAVVTDAGNGTASAELTVAAPTVIGSCSELTLAMTNGAGITTYANLGVHFRPTGGMLPWYKDNIALTPSGGTLSYSEGFSYSYDLPTGTNALELSAALGVDKQVSYDPISATFAGSLSGSGSLGFALPVGNPKVTLLGSAGMKMEGSLDVSLAGCGAPEMTASWSVGYDNSAGLKAPVVLALDIVAPGVGTSLSQIPGIDSLKLQLLLKAHGGITAEYASHTPSNCWLGATGFTGSVGGGLEGTALIELGKHAETGVYVGGDGTWGLGICPDFAINSYTGKVYAGAYAELFGFEAHKEVAAEITWDFTDDGASPKVLASSDLSLTKDKVLWQPIGTSLDQWGDSNRATAIPLSAAALQAKAATGSMESLLLENVIGLASPSVFADSNGNRILYAHHNTAKPWYAATDIGSISGSAAAGWTTALVTDDQAAEFHPQATDIGDNQLLAAWTRVFGDTSSATSPDEVVPHLEVVAARYDRIAGTWSTPEQLTANGSVDRDPLPVRFGTQNGALWIGNQGGLLTGNSTSGDSLLFRQWTGTAWSAPIVLYSAQKGIPAFSFTADASGEGHVVFTVDEDGNADTVEDRELYRIATASGVWQAATRLTTDTVEDTLPVLTAPNGIPMLVWKTGETLRFTPVAAWNPADVYSENTLANEAPTLDGVTMPGGAAIAYTVQNEKGIDIVAAFYDASLNLWSLPVPLTDDEHAESALSLAYDGTELILAYLKTQTLRSDVTVELNGQSQTIPDVPQPGRTDLYVLSHALARDPAVVTLRTAPENPAPNQAVTVTATVANLGDLPLEFVPVSFYDGDPAGNGSLIGVTATTGIMVAGTKQTVQIAWQMPQETVSRQIFAVADPGLTIEDRNRANNSGSQLVSLPDLVVDTARSEQITADTVALTARIRNAGVIPSGTFKVSWRLGAADGPLIATATVDTIPAGSLYDATAAWAVGSASNPDEYAQVFVTLDFAESVTELKEDNNTGLQSVHKPYATGVFSVTLTDEAAANGVQWSVDGGSTWYDSKGLVPLPVGTYTVTFSQVNGWALPTIGNVALGGSQSVTLTSNPERAGDMDGDGIVDLLDALVALRIAAGQDVPLTGPWYGAGTDATIGIEEALRALHQVSGLP